MKIETEIKLMNYSTVLLVTIAMLTPFVYDGLYSKVIGEPLNTPLSNANLALATLPIVLEISEGQYNALRITKDLLKTSNMSKGELLSTLEGKGFSQADATYALDNIKPNWGIRAQYTAIDILETNPLPLTKEELYIQLTGEFGFTANEANEGISYIDYPAYLKMKKGLLK